MGERNQYGVKRRGNRWIARPYIPGQNRHAWAGTWNTEAEAVAAALARITEEQRLPANRETVATFAARWIADYPRPKASTNDRYRADAQRFAKVHGSRKLHEITVPLARSYALKHRHDLGALRAMFTDARREGLVLSNPFSNLGIAKGPGRSGIVVVTAEELGELAEIARRTQGRDFGPVFRAIVVFAAYTGLRPGEVFGLDWDAIDFEAETIHVRQQWHKRRLTLPKSGKTRTVFLPPPAAQALRAMPRTVGAEHVFPGKLGQRITQSALSAYWGKARTAFEASLSESRRMDFERVKGSLDFYAVTRHFCATYLVEQGVPSWIVARQLGHEDGGRLVEKTYGHPSDKVARERLREAFCAAPMWAVEEATG